MSYFFDVFDEGHIIVFVIGADVDPVNEMIQAAREIVHMLDTGPDRIVIISDVRNFTLSNFSDLLELSNTTRHPEVARIAKHPKIHRLLSVISSPALQLAARGLNSASFGYIDVAVYPTLEEAVASARSLLSAPSKAS